jgi:hypothetical protein
MAKLSYLGLGGNPASDTAQEKAQDAIRNRQ